MRIAQIDSTKTESFEKRLRDYALGAGAVAAGLVTFSPPAAAKVVVIPAHVTLEFGSAPFPISFEGTTEFTVANSGGGGYKTHWDLVDVSPGSQAEEEIERNQLAALEKGAEIGPAQRFGARTGSLAFAWSASADSSRRTSGPFANTANRFLGLRFRLNGEVHYGWVAVSKVSANYGEVVATLTGYAYETEPNTPIYAGLRSDGPPESLQLREGGMAPDTTQLQLATPGVLALGSLGLDAWRKRKTGLQESS